MAQRPQAILFDADGVLQRPAIDFRAALGHVLGAGGDELEHFMRELFAVEKPALTGERDFVADLRGVLDRFGVGERLPDALAVWTAIEPDAALCDAVTRLRAGGMRCCLATNQQPYRGRHMSEVLRYRELFDHEFYSHEVGFAKPDPAYFRAIADRLGVVPFALLFIDDHEPNVAAARQVGLRAAVFPPPPNANLAALQAILELHDIALL